MPDADPAAIGLALDDRPVATYVWRPTAPTAAAPRPYLHPVYTLGGVAVTEIMPVDHRHHVGVSIAVADVDGHNFWGGATFVRDRGPTMLDNHGQQLHTSWLRRTPSRVVQELSWITRSGVEVLAERRTIAARAIDDECWALELAFELTNIGASPLTFASPATNGRSGAGYGGLFWRAPGSSTGVRAFSPHGCGADAVHGTTSRWLALTGIADDGRGWTLVFLPTDQTTSADPWFVRTDGYPGVGSSLAWATPLTVAASAGITRSFAVLVADGELSARRVHDLVTREQT